MDPFPLDDAQVRVLGCLIEKELATPEYYPMTLNALAAACNQKTNRYPVLDLKETDVADAIEMLQLKRLAVAAGDGGRARKYRHLLTERLHLEDLELALLCELMVRGPQTLGELRTRADRMVPIKDVETVEDALDGLVEQEPPLVAKLPRQPGQKEGRYAHLLGGKPEGGIAGAGSMFSAAALATPPDRVAVLEAEVGRLKEEIRELRRRVDELEAG